MELPRSNKRREPTSRPGSRQDVSAGQQPVASLPGLVAILSPWRRKKRGRFKDRPSTMSIRVSGVYLVPSPAANNEPANEKPSNLSVENNLHQQHHHHHHHHAAKTVTIVAGPQRSNSLDYLNFEEKRQIIASSLSLSDFLAHGPAAAAAAAKEVAANTVIGEFSNNFASQNGGNNLN